MKTGSVLMPDLSQQRLQANTDLLPLPNVPLPWLTMPALTGGLMWLCFYPLGWGFLGWVVLVPFLFLVRLEARPWQIYLGAYLGGSVFFWAALQWMRVADPRMFYTWAMLATYCALYFPVALFLIRRLGRATAWPLSVTVPLVWTALEFLRSFLGTGFAWYFLGHTQHHFLAVIQVADLAGVYAITFVAAAVNGWLVDYLGTIPEIQRSFRQEKDSPKSVSLLGFVMVVGLVAGMLLYGCFRLSQDDFRPGPRLALLQGSLDQRLRNEADTANKDSLNPSENVFEYFWHMCRLASVQVPTPDLVVWSETSFPYNWYELPGDLNKIPMDTRDVAGKVQKLLRMVAGESQTNQLFGLNTRVLNDKGEVRPYNSALLMSSMGNTLGIYDKIHRVPFGEYVPLRDWLPFMNYFAPYDYDYSIRMGEKLTRFQLGNYRFGVIICYEDTDPFLARQYARNHVDGPPVDFLINISNDGWFDGSSQHAEHLAISRFRAIETRRPLARAVNMGISAVIDSNGRVQAPKEFPVPGKVKMWAVVEDKEGRIPDLPEGKWGDFTKTQGVLLATIPLDDRFSLYAWTGDLLPGGCWLLLVSVWLWRKVYA